MPLKMKLFKPHQYCSPYLKGPLTQFATSFAFPASFLDGAYFKRAAVILPNFKR